MTMWVGRSQAYGAVGLDERRGDVEAGNQLWTGATSDKGARLSACIGRERFAGGID